MPITQIRLSRIFIPYYKIKKHQQIDKQYVEVLSGGEKRSSNLVLHSLFPLSY